MKKLLCALIAVLLCVQLVPPVALPVFATEVTVPTANDTTDTHELDLTLMSLGEFCNVHFDPAFEEKLSDAERKLYTTLVQGTEAGEERMDVSACGMTDVDAFRAFLQDVLNTQLVNVRVSDRVTVVIRDGVIAEVHFSYLPQVFSRSASFSTVEQGMAHALATVNDSMTNVEKALVLHDYLVREVDYDLGYFTDTIAMDSYRLEGVFIKRVAVCQGYALAYSLLLSELGIESYVVSSDDMNHAWNLINLDGNWFHVDCTWDDPTNEYEVDFCRGGFVRHDYFLRSDSEFLDLEHFGWVIQMGEEAAPEASVENSYEGYLFRGDVGCISTLNGYYYALSSYYGSNILIRSNMDGTDRTEYTLPRTYDYLFVYGDYLYASAENFVYELNPDGSERRIVAATTGIIENFWLKLDSMEYYESFPDGTCFKQTVDPVNGAENLIIQDDCRFIVTGDSTCTLYDYLGNSTSVTIPETVNGYTVTSIWENAFERKNLYHVSIPDTVVEIGDYAFFQTNLEDATLPAHLAVLGDRAFWNCIGLKNVTFPATLTSIGQEAFTYCFGLTDVYFEGAVPADWGENCFLGGEGVEVLIHYPENAAGWTSPTWESPDGYTINTVSYNPDMLEDPTACGKAAHWTYADHVLTITGEGDMWNYGTGAVPWSAYRYEIQTVVISEGITGIGEYAFFQMHNLAEVILPSTLTKIGAHAFEHCRSLYRVVLPENVTSIGDKAFSHCYGLKDVCFAGDVPADWGWGAFAADDEEIPSIFVRLRYVAGAKGWTSPTWSDAYGLTYQCSTCDPAIMNDPAACGDNAHWSFADGVLTITGEGELWSYYSMSAKPWYKYESEIQKIVISEGITRIGSRAFSGIYNATEVVFPESLTAIDECAFQECHRLVKVYLPKNLKSLGHYAFQSCRNLTDVYFAGDVPAYWGMNPFTVRYTWVDDVEVPEIQATLHYIDGNAGWTTPTWEDAHGITYACERYNPDALNDPTACGDYAHWSYADHVLTITGEGEMWNYTDLQTPWEEFQYEIYSVLVSEGITRIGGGAFVSMTNMQTVTLPTTLREIGPYAFRFSRFNQIELPQGLTTIEQGAFWNNNSLGKIMLPASLTYLGDDAFGACHSLTKVYFAGDVPAYWGSDAFVMSTNYVDGEKVSYTDATLYYVNGAAGWTTPIWEDPYGFAYNTAVYDPEILNDPTACGNAVHWSYADNVLTLTGEGATWDYAKAEARPWDEYRGQIREVMVSEGITRLGDCVLADIPNMNSVSLPDTLMEIGDQAFLNSRSLGRIILPENLHTFGDNAFRSCSSLMNVYFQGSAPANWGSEVFVTSWVWNEDGTERIPVVQATLRYPAEVAGWTTPTWTDVHGTVYNCAPYDPEVEFDPTACGDRMHWSYEDGTLTITGEGAMWNYGRSAAKPWENYRGYIEKLVVGEGITYLGSYTFCDMYNLREVTLPASLTNIGEGAFYSVRIGRIILPENLQTLGNMAFAYCDTLMNVYFEGPTPANWGTDVFMAGYEWNPEGTEKYPVIKATLRYLEGSAGWTTPTWTDVHGTVYNCSPYDPEAEFDPSFCGNKIRWALEDGTLTITGEGAMWDYARSQDTPWYNDRYLIQKIVVSEGVTRIGSFAFQSMRNVREILLPESLTSIGRSAFAACYNLGSIVLPKNLNSLEDYAFQNCGSLTTVYFQGNVPAKWGRDVFVYWAWDEVTETSVPAVQTTLRYIQGNAGWTTPTWTDTYGYTYDCKSYNPDALNDPTACGDYAHWSFEGGVLTITGEGEMWDFAEFEFIPWKGLGVPIYKIVISEGVTRIGNYAFARLWQLNEVSLPESLTEIGEGAFDNCSLLGKIILPKNLNTIEVGAFRYCNNLADVYFAGDVPANWGADAFIEGSDKVDGVIISYVSAALHYVEGTNGWTTPTWTDPHGYVYNCTTYNPEALNDPTACGDYTHWSFEDGTLTITGQGPTWNYSAGSDHPWAEYRYQIQKIVVDEGVTCLGNYIFARITNVREVVLPDSLRIIGEGAFQDCGSLTSVTLPKNVVSLSGGAFRYCSGLMNVYFEGAVPTDWGVDVFVAYWEWEDDSEDGIPVIQTALRYQEGSAGWTTPTWTDVHGTVYNCSPYDPDAEFDPTACGDHAHWSFEDGTLTITGEGAMWNMGSSSIKPWDEHRWQIQKIVVSEGITRLGNYVFCGTGNVSEVVLPESLMEIGEGALENCNNLSKIQLPKNLTSIGNYAFRFCNNLNTVYFEGNTPAQWGKDVFVVNWIWDEETSQNIPVIQVTIRYVEETEGWTTPTWTDAYGYTYECAPYDPDVLNDPTACGDKAHWAYAGNVLTITGEGEMWDYASGDSTPWGEYLDQIEQIVISEGITRIGNYAFEDANARDAVLPSTLEEIGSRAFMYVGLGKLELPESLVRIEESAFWNCYGLTKLTIPAGVDYIGDSAFGACHNLGHVYFEGDVPSYWGNGVFEVYMENDTWGIQVQLRYLEGAAGWTSPTWTDLQGYVYNTSIYDPEVINDPTACGDKAHWSYENGALTITGEGEMWDYGSAIDKPWNEHRYQIRKIVVSEGITRLGDYAFYNTGNVTEVVLPESLTEIGNSAISACYDLMTLTVPKNVDVLGDAAFAFNSSLMNVYFEGDVPSVWGQDPFVVWLDDDDLGVMVTLRYLEGSEGWTSPAWTDAYGVTYNCFSYDPETAFDPTACGDNAHWSFADGVLTITGEGAIWDYPVDSVRPWQEYRWEIARVIVSEGITRIGNYTFQYMEFGEIDLPDSLVEIGRGAFYGAGLPSITLPKNTDWIEKEAFGFCDSLGTVYFEGDIPSHWEEDVFTVWLNEDTTGVRVKLRYLDGAEGWSTPTWEDPHGYVYDCAPYNPDVLNDPTACGDYAHWTYDNGTLTITGEGDMWDYAAQAVKPWSAHEDWIERVVVGEGITRIGNYAFSRLDITEVALPSTLMEIGRNAFASLPITSLELPESLTTIGVEAFWNCYSLGRVVIPKSVDYIGDYAFEYCHALTNVFFKGDVPAYWGRDAFADNYNYIDGETVADIQVAIHYLEGTDGWTTPTWTDPYGYTYECMPYDPDILNDPTACGDKAHWSFADGVLTITGEGAMWNYGGWNSVPWYEYRYAIQEIVVSEGITRIGNYAFSDLPNLYKLELPETLLEIGEEAFRYCYSLQRIVLPENLSVLGDEAFAYCEILTNVYFTGDVPDVWGNNVFLATWDYDEASGTEFPVIQANIYYLEGADGWTTPTWTDRFGYTYNCAPYDPDEIVRENACGDKAEWEFKGGVLTITGEGAMWDFDANTVPWKRHSWDIYEIVVSEGITRIGNHAFQNTVYLRTVSLPESLEEIGEYAFTGCNQLGKVVLPASLTTLGAGAFRNCNTLANVYFEGDVPTVWGEDAFVERYDEEATLLEVRLHCTEGAEGWTTPTWTDVHGHTFPCSLFDPEVIKDPTACGDKAHWSFENGTLTITGEGAVWDFAFTEYCPWEEYVEDIERIVISEGITRIGNFAFADTSVAEVTLPETLKEIGMGAFTENFRLETISLPASLEKVEKGAFYNCICLRYAVFAGSPPMDWGESVFGSEIMDEETLKSAVTICYMDANSGWTSPVWTDLYGISHDCMEYDPAIINRENACGTNAIWSYADGVLTITGEGDMWLYAGLGFRPWDVYADDIRKVVISEGITGTGVYAFSELGITEISLPASLKTVGYGSFAYCDYLEEVYLPASVDTLETDAFYACDALVRVTFAGDVPAKWGPDVFTLHYYMGRPVVKVTIRYQEGAEGWTTPEWVDPYDIVYNTEVISATGFAVQGVLTVEGKPDGIAIRLLDSDGKEVSGVSFTVTLVEGTESTYQYTVTGVQAGEYDLEISKPGALSYTICGIPVEGNMDLTDNANEDISDIRMSIGDINSDGSIDLQDVAMLTSSNTYSRSYEEAENKSADVNGDRLFDLQDLAIITSTNNYSAKPVEVQYSNLGA